MFSDGNIGRIDEIIDHAIEIIQYACENMDRVDGIIGHINKLIRRVDEIIGYAN